MTDLAALGLIVCTGSGNGQDDRRLELRLKSNNDFVAWFQTNTRLSAGEKVVSTSTQFIHREGLTSLQAIAIRAWLHEQLQAAI